MTPKEFRDAITAEILAWGSANFPTIPIVYENGPVPDEDKIGPIWLDVEVRWYGGSVASMGTTPRTRMTGAVSVCCFRRSAEGTDQSDLAIDSVNALLGVRRFGSAVMGAPQRTVPTHLRGWYKTGALIPFELG